jgi:DNA-directed RNA polymerase sigma subunit (sigma70/sigma32)
MTAEKVIEVQKYGREPISLHTLLGEDGDRKFGDLIKDPEAIQPGEALSFTLLQSNRTRCSAPCPSGRPAWCPCGSA